MLLGHENPLVSLSANTAQLQEHLPPVDTIDATLKTKDGATGTVSISFGTTYKADEYSVAFEKGVVSVSRSMVTVGEESKQVENERTGVPPEVRAWGEAIVAAKMHGKQSPEEALADLELLEGMLRSGEQGGRDMALLCQSW